MIGYVLYSIGSQKHLSEELEHVMLRDLMEHNMVQMHETINVCISEEDP